MASARRKMEREFDARVIVSRVEAVYGELATQPLNERRASDDRERAGGSGGAPPPGK
jgi:hypothetical protein